MARSKVGLVKNDHKEGRPKLTRQGNSANTKYSATSRNSRKKPYRGQGK